MLYFYLYTVSYRSYHGYSTEHQDIKSSLPTPSPPSFNQSVVILHSNWPHTTPVSRTLHPLHSSFNLKLTTICALRTSIKSITKPARRSTDLRRSNLNSASASASSYLVPSLFTFHIPGIYLQGPSQPTLITQHGKLKSLRKRFSLLSSQSTADVYLEMQGADSINTCCTHTIHPGEISVEHALHFYYSFQLSHFVRILSPFLSSIIDFSLDTR